MKIGQMLKEKGSNLSFEFFPPKEKEAEDQLFGTIAKLKELDPGFVSVTYGAGGSTSKNTYNIIKRIKEETGLTSMPHLTCINQTDNELKAILEDYKKLDIENLLALRGDPPMVDGKPVPIKPTDCHASELVTLAAKYNAFSISVAGYPEGHLESSDIETDMKYTKVKVDAGADFIITQMFFDNTHFYKFQERAYKWGINVPILAGIMPIADINRIKSFCDKCGATLPDRIVAHFAESASTPRGMKEAGIEVVTEQCADLLAHGVRYFHFYTLNHSGTVSRIIRNAGLLNLNKQNTRV